MIPMMNFIEKKARIYLEQSVGYIQRVVRHLININVEQLRKRKILEVNNAQP
jgi:hypothetical protein